MDEKDLYEMACVNRRCPTCGKATRQIEKDTFSGREMREFACEACGWKHDFDFGPALWTFMSGSRDDDAGSPRVPPGKPGG
jgi:rubredoxin